jgi:O-antigen ligase
LGRDYHPDYGLWHASYTGVTTSKNLLGMTTLILGLGSTWCFLHALLYLKGRRKTGPLVAQGIILVSMIWLFWITNSATSMSCFLMAGLLLAVTRLHRLGRRQAVVHLLVIAVLSISLSAVFGGSLLGIVGRDPTLTGRTDIWNLVLSLKGNPLVGTGFESYWLGWRRVRLWSVYRFHLNEAHNGYIETYLNLGWMGIALLGCVAVAGYRNVVAELRRNREMGSLRLAYFVVALMYNLSESAFGGPNPVWILFLMAVIAVPEAAARQDSGAGVDRTGNVADSESPIGYLPGGGPREGVTPEKVEWKWINANCEATT